MARVPARRSRQAQKPAKGSMEATCGTHSCARQRPHPPQIGSAVHKPVPNVVRPFFLGNWLHNMATSASASELTYQSAAPVFPTLVASMRSSEVAVASPRFEYDCGDPRFSA